MVNTVSSLYVKHVYVTSIKNLSLVFFSRLSQVGTKLNMISENYTRLTNKKPKQIIVLARRKN